jgi:hypothetical protein
VIHVHGPKTFTTSYGLMHQILAGPVGLGPSGVEVLYKLDDDEKWFVNLTTAAHMAKYSTLHGKSIDLSNTHGISLRLKHQDKQRVMGTMHKVNTTYKKEAVEGIIRGFTEDPDVEVFQSKKAGDKWNFLFKPANNIDIPHHITMMVQETQKFRSFLITLPGRKTKCLHCSLDTHWSKKCPSRVSKGKPQSAPAKRPEPDPVPATEDATATTATGTEGVTSPDTTPSASTVTQNPRQKKTTKRPGNSISPTASPIKIRERKDYTQQANKDNSKIDDTCPDKETTETTEEQKHAQISSPKKLIIDLTPEETKKTENSQKEQEPLKVNSTR